MKHSLLSATILFLLICGGGPVTSARADRAGQDMVRDSDDELNRVYQKTLARLTNAEAKAKLREAQRAWIAFRDAESAMMYALTNMSLDTEIHVAAMTGQRTKQLQALPASDEAATADATAAASGEDSTPMDRDYKVRCQVGLVVHATPDAKGRRVGTLEDGQKIQLDGKKGPRNGTVFPVVSKDKDTVGATWIQIKAPLQGYILFQADGQPENDYIVPQVLPE